MCPSCNGKVNYTQNVLHDVLIRGLADSKIQLDLLGDKNQDMSLETVLQFVEAKEAGKRLAGHLQQSQRLDAACSQYRCTKQDEIKDQSKPGSCNYCGKHGHGKNAPPGLERVSVLPMAQHVHTANGRTIMRLSVTAKEEQRPSTVTPQKVPPVRLKAPSSMPSVQPPASAAILGRMPSH